MLTDIVCGTIFGLKPPDWRVKESLTLLAPDGQANLIASSEPLDESINSELYAEMQGDLLRKEFAAYKEFAYEAISVFGGRRGFMRRFEWLPPDSDSVTQLQVYYADSGRGYTITATTPSSQYARFELQFVELLESLQLNTERGRQGASDSSR